MMVQLLTVTIQCALVLPVWSVILAGVLMVVLLLVAVMLWQSFRNEVYKNNVFMSIAQNMHTPLTLMKLSMNEILEDERLLEEHGKLQYQISHLSNNVTKMLHLTDHFIISNYPDFSRNLPVARYDLNSFVFEAISPYISEAKIRNIRLNLNRRDDSCNVWIDSERMTTIIQNVMLNALSDTKENGCISVSLEYDNAGWSICLEMDGIKNGIEEKMLSFSSLFQKRCLKQRDLRISELKSRMMLIDVLVKSHFGTVALMRLHENAINMKFLFPRESSGYQKVASERKVDKKVIPPGCSMRTGYGSYLQAIPRLMLVEDDEEFAAYLLNLLHKYYEVVVVKNGVEALQKIGFINPNIILSEFMMPEMCGNELCRQIKGMQEYSSIPFLLISGLPVSDFLLEGIFALADVCIVKPFDGAVLLAALSNLLKNRDLVKNGVKHERRHELIDGCSEEDMRFIAKVNELIEKNMSDSSFRIDQLSASLNMSRSCFFNRIKTLKGISPSDYLLDKRIEKAASLLATTTRSVYEVADSVGFNDANYFGVVFKKHCGKTPRRYREHLKEND